MQNALNYSALFVLVALLLSCDSQIKTTLTWEAHSKTYKQEVLAEPAREDELKHIEWDGDGWGSAPTGDWTGYVVYDPSNALAAVNQNQLPAKIKGIPCSVIKVRQLEDQWYSVVLDMNQFWDKMHPNC